MKMNHLTVYCIVMGELGYYISTVLIVSTEKPRRPRTQKYCNWGSVETRTLTYIYIPDQRPPKKCNRWQSSSSSANSVTPLVIRPRRPQTAPEGRETTCPPAHLSGSHARTGGAPSTPPRALSPCLSAPVYLPVCPPVSLNL